MARNNSGEGTLSIQNTYRSGENSSKSYTPLNIRLDYLGNEDTVRYSQREKSMFKSYGTANPGNLSRATERKESSETPLEVGSS